MSDPRSMGSEFMQRRAAAAAAGKPGSNTTAATGGSNTASSTLTSLGSASDRKTAPAGGGGGGGGAKKSFADIQREQEQEQRQGGRGGRGGGGQQRGMGGMASSGGQRHQQGGGMGTPQQPSRPPRGILQRPEPAVDDYPRLARPSDHHRGGNRRNDDRRSHQTANPRASLLLEQGSIHTLLDKFGFLRCADRDAELFFHYSEFKSGHSDALNIGDEVEFRVGTAEDRGRRGRGGGGGEGGGEKLCALNVRVLEPGTIKWEVEDAPGKRWTGTVDRPPAREGRMGGGGRGTVGSTAGGTIRLVETEEADADKTEENETPPLEIHFRPADYADKPPGHARLERKDVVAFDLVTERRTGKKCARNISLVQSERERQRLEREAKLLEDATLERGRVVSERGECGYIQSASRAEEVYFHVSHLVDEPDKKKKEAEAAKDERRGMPSDVRTTSLLKEGQEVEFYVVDEGSGGGGGGGGGRNARGGNKGLTARKIKLLPKGSVKFEHALASGVVGTVIECPVAAAPAGFGRRDSDNRRAATNVDATVAGKVRLAEPITDEHGATVTEVALSPDLYPGGTFAVSRAGGEMGIWIRPGDVLLFDVVQKVVDGSCRAVPTKCLLPKTAEKGVANDSAAAKIKPAVRLVDLSLCGRAEGVVKSVKDNFGFIHLAERNADVYFPLFEVFPNDVHGDLSRNDSSIVDGSAEATTGGGRVHVEAGMEVSFDLCVQAPPTDHRGGGGGRYGRGPSGRPPPEKEALRARRVRRLPAGTVLEKEPIASSVTATVAKVEQRQPFAGTLELEETITFEHLAGRHPLVGRLLDDVARGRYGDALAFPEVLPEADEHTIASMVSLRDDLEWRHVPEGADDRSARRLCIARKTEAEEAGGAEETGRDSVVPVTDGADASKNANGEGADASADASSTAKKSDAPKKKGKKAKVLRTVRFDKSSFPDLSEGPLGVGDVLTCDVFQLRRSGAILAEHIAVVERKAPPAAVVVSDGEEGKAAPRTGATGLVTEIVSARQFGFITAVDAEGNRGEHVFFHFNEIAAAGEDAALDAPPSSLSAAAGSRGRKFSRGDNSTAAVNKGDEVTFDVGIGKNGKLCATHVSLLPRGTLKLPPAKADASPTCTGYVLMEPSHTSLANTPSHVAVPSGPSSAFGGAGSRWDNVKSPSAGRSGSNVKEEGVILLLTDPSHLFTPRPKKADADGAPCAGDVSAAKTSAKSTDESEGKAKDNQPPPPVVGMHIRYRPSSMAARGTGASGRSEPRRGDLVSFGKTRGAKIVKEIRIEKAAAATNVRGVLTDLDLDEDTAVFVSSENEADKYDIRLTEVVSCNKALLKDKEQVDGILHEGKIFGVCRTKDIFLASSMSKYSSGGSSSGPKERPRLNLTVKKELQGMGGKIMAQSRMAKGPDGTNGFAAGWTTRVSPHAAEEEEEAGAEEEEGEEEDSALATSLSAGASEFVPNFSTATSGFESTDE